MKIRERLITFILHCYHSVLWYNRPPNSLLFLVYWYQHVPNRNLTLHPTRFRTMIIIVPFAPIIVTNKWRWLTNNPLPPPWRALLKPYPPWTLVPLLSQLCLPSSHPCSIPTVQPHHSTFPIDPDQLPTPMPARRIPNHGTFKSKPYLNSSSMFAFALTRLNETPSRLAVSSPSPLEALPIMIFSPNISWSPLSTPRIYFPLVPTITPFKTPRRSTPCSPSLSPEPFTILYFNRRKIYLPIKKSPQSSRYSHC